MELSQKCNSINTKDDLVNFIEELKFNLISRPNEWENSTLEKYLDAMGAWLNSMENAYKNMGKEFPEQPSWKMFAEILHASKIYE
jgi:hypothetical protein